MVDKPIFTATINKRKDIKKSTLFKSDVYKYFLMNVYKFFDF